jgi:FMN phosphatase YigB (HAD superfamily)
MIFIKRALAVLFITCLLVGCVIQPITPTIKPIVKYAEIEDEIINDKTLVLLDIDNTIFRSKIHYGSAEFFAQMVKDEVISKACTESEAKINVYDRWIKSQQLVETKLIDQQIHSFIDIARKNGATIIAFTARQPTIATITSHQLAKHHIELDKLAGLEFSKSYDHNLSNQNKYSSKSIFYEGILFTHDLNAKGRVFIDFYQSYKNYSMQNNFQLPDRIVFVDDGMHNLISLKEVMPPLNVKFYGYHIKSDFKFDPEVAQREETLHIKKIANGQL